MSYIIESLLSYPCKKMNSFFSAPIFSLLILCVFHFLVDFMIGIWPVFKTLNNLDVALAGLIWAIGASCGEGMQVVFGRLSDSGHRKALILFGVLVSASGAFFAYTTSYPLFGFLFWLVCLGSGAFHPAAVGMVGRLNEKRRSTYITIFAMFGALGLAMSQITYSWVYLATNANTFYLIIPAFLLVVFSLKSAVLPATDNAKKKRPPFLSFLKFFKNRSLRLLYISQVCNQALAWGLIFLLPDLLKSRGYEPWLVYGGGHLAYVLGGVFLLIPSGFLADKYSSKSVIWISSLIGTLALYSILFMPELEEGQIIPLLFITGAAIAVVNPVSVSLGNKISPSNPGMVSAFLMGCVWCVAEFIGPGGGSLLTKLFEEDAYARALMLLGLISFAGIMAAYSLPAEADELAVDNLID